MDGKTIRLNRLFLNGKMLCVPLDHGITNGPIANLAQFKSLSSDIIDNNATSIIVHKGMIRFLPNIRHTGLIIHLSASTQYYNEVNKVVVCDVEEALKYGADAVSMHINVGNQFEQQMIRDFSAISAQCSFYNIPLLAMVYVRDNNNMSINSIDRISHAVRIVTELGADIIKIPTPDNLDLLHQIVETTDIPIIVAGGERMNNDNELIVKTKTVMAEGIAGISFGRNIFESPNPKYTLGLLRDVIIN